MTDFCIWTSRGAFQMEWGSALVLFKNSFSPAFICQSWSPLRAPGSGTAALGTGAAWLCPEQDLLWLCQPAKTSLNKVWGGKILREKERKEEEKKMKKRSRRRMHLFHLFETFFFFSCNVSPKSLDRIGQEHSFRISACDGFRIWSKHVLLCFHRI